MCVCVCLFSVVFVFESARSSLSERVGGGRRSVMLVERARAREEKIMSTDKLFARILPYAETHTEGERARARERERERERERKQERASARVRERERARTRERERERDEDAGRKRPATGKFSRYRFRL